MLGQRMFLALVHPGISRKIESAPSALLSASVTIKPL